MTLKNIKANSDAFEAKELEILSKTIHGKSDEDMYTLAGVISGKESANREWLIYNNTLIKTSIVLGSINLVAASSLLIINIIKKKKQK